MTKTHRITKTRLAGGMVAAFFLSASLVSTGLAQETMPSPASTIEVVSSVSPDSVLPGGHGQVILTGKFRPNVTLDFDCKGAQFRPDSFNVESPTRIVAQVTVPIEAEEGPCDTFDRNLRPALIGKQSFRVSYSANMPVTLRILLVGQGNMQLDDVLESASKIRMALAQKGDYSDPSGTVELGGGTIKYVQGATSFSYSTSAVKGVEELKIGLPNMRTQYFRIIFNDGKIYNFQDLAHGDAVFALLKKKLGK